MAELVLGRLKFKWKGNWAADTEYIKDDVVNYNGTSWVCVANHTSDLTSFITDRDGNKWEEMIRGVNYDSQWSSSSTYQKNDIVTYDGSAWISTVDGNINNQPDINNEWSLFAQGTTALTTLGDLLYRSVSDTDRLPIGTENQTLQVSATGIPEWTSNVDVPGTLGVTGNTTLGGTLGVTGNATLSGTLGVTGNATLSGTLGVTGNTTLTGDLAVNGGDVTSSATTFNLLNSTVTTLNLGGAADVNLGGAAKTVAVNNNLTVGGRSVTDGVIYQGVDPVTQATTDGFTDTVAVLVNDTNAFSQVTHKNINAGTDASTDFIAYADNGDNDSGWIDMGITSSGFTAAAFGLTEANDGYLFFSSPASAPSAKGNLVIATDSNGVDNDIIFATGGFATGQEKMRLTDQDHDGFNKGLNLMDDVSTTSGAFYVGPNAKTLTQNSTGYAGLTHVTGLFVDDVDDFVQFAIKNNNTGTSASTDLIAYSSDGDNDSGWIDLGITSENFSDPEFTVTGPNTGYLFMSAPDADGLVTTIGGGTLSAVATTITVADTTGFPATGTLVIAGGEQVTYTGTTATTFTGCTRGANSSTATTHASGTRVYKLSSATYTGDLLIGTGIGGSHNDIVLFSGGFDAGNERIRIIGNTRAGHAAGVEILAATNSTSTTTGALRVDGGIGLQGNLYVGGNVNIVGTITLGGTGDTVETSSLSVTDPIIRMGNGNTTDLVDLGFVGIYGSSGTKYTGLVRDASDNGKYKLFTGLSTNPTTTVDFTGATLATLSLGTLEATSATATDVTATNFKIGANTVLSGSTLGSTITGSSLTSVGTLTSLSSGAITTTGTLAVNASGGVTTNQTTFPLVNTTATTINFGGAATALNMGATASATTVLIGGANTGNTLQIASTTGGTVNVRSQVTTGSVNLFADTTTGTVTVGSAAAGKLAIAFNSSSSSTSTGALTVAGGVGVTGSLYAGAVYDNGTRVASTGKAIAMAMVFG